MSDGTRQGAPLPSREPRGRGRSTPAPWRPVPGSLPVYVKGALFSAGDCHAAQGDGEVCVTGIECPMQFSLRFNVIKGWSLPPWRYEFITPPGPLQPRSDAKGYFLHTALGPDLLTNA